MSEGEKYEKAWIFSFINVAKDFFRYSTDAPEAYGEATALSILGHAVGREVVNLIQPGVVYHNGYFNLVGPSTKSRKTTVQKLGQKIYEQDRWLPNESSPEKLLANLSEKPEGFMWMGEFSKLLKGINGRGYMATMAEDLNNLFDCPDLYKRELMKESYEIKGAYLSCHTTITPEVLKENTSREMFDGGLFPRWLFVKGEPCPKPRGKLIPDTLKLYEILKGIVDGILEMEKDVCFELSEEALKYFNEEIEEKVIYSEKYAPVGAFAGRYENYIIAFADLYLISDAIDRAMNNEKSIAEMKMSEMINCLIEGRRLLSRSGNLDNLDNLVLYNICKEEKEENTKLTKGKKLPKLPKLLSLPEFKCIVPKEYVERAFNFVKPCLDFVLELAEYIDMDKPTARAREYIRNKGQVSRVEIMTNTNLNKDKLDLALDTLMERKEVKIETIQNPKFPNRKQVIYKWVKGGET
jgi:hypothetical protein